MTSKPKDSNSAQAGFQADVITLQGRELPVSVGYVEQSSLRFYAENPRIFSHIWKEAGHEPTQHEIFEVLARREHVKEVLVPSIRANGGLIEPILIRGNVVLEGNSRLAAYKLLAPEDSEKWKRIRVRKLPDTVTDSEVFSLLGQYHIVGKTDWIPFEQAGYLYRRNKIHGVDEAALRKEIGLSDGRIRHLIRVYDFMIKADDRTTDRWSYYDELLRPKKFAKAIESNPKFVEIVVEKIKSGQIERAVDIRDRLPLIVNAGGNTLKRFLAGKLTFDNAVADARERGAGDYNATKLRDFRHWLAEDQLDAEFAKAPDGEKGSLKFELNQIQRRVKRLLSILGA